MSVYVRSVCLCASCQSYIEVLIKSSLGTNPGIYPAPSVPGEPGEPCILFCQSKHAKVTNPSNNLSKYKRFQLRKLSKEN